MEARAFLSEALEGLDVNVDRDAACLLTSELASNAVRHGKEPIGVSVSVEEEGLLVSVFDRGTGFDPDELSLDPAPGAEGPGQGGWGLQLVQNLSSEWGVERRGDGTEVWFRL